MLSKITPILLLLTLLILGLVYGAPVEVNFQPGHRISVLISAVAVGSAFFFLFRQSLRLQSRGLSIGSFVVTALVLLPYLWIGIWTVPTAVLSDEYPRYQDIYMYKNKRGEVLIGRLIEVSGSLHHTEMRKVLHDFNNGIRISVPYPEETMNGIWELHQLKSSNSFISNIDTTYTVEFENGRIKK